MTTEERLEVMERELAEMKTSLAVSRRRSRRLWIGLGLTGVVCILAWGFVVKGGIAQAQRTGEVIRANTFIVEDESGTIRAILSVDKDGPRLLLKDENGTTRIGLSVDKDGQGLALYDENSTPRAGLALYERGPMLSLYDENKTLSVALVVDNDFGARVGMFDVNGEGIWSAP